MKDFEFKNIPSNNKDPINLDELGEISEHFLHQNEDAINLTVPEINSN